MRIREKEHYCTPCTIYGDRPWLQVKTARKPLSVVQVNYAFDRGLDDPDTLLDRYWTLTGWSDALVGAGAAPVVAVQRFYRDARVTRGGVDYVFCRAGVAAAVAACRPDVVHVNGLTFPLQLWRLRRALEPSTAVVVQSHADGGEIGRAPVFRMLGRVTRSAADAFLFAAAAHADAWREAGFIAPDQPTFQVMPASSTLAPFDKAQGRPIDRAAARADSGVGGSPAILWVGRLNANKDPLTALDGFERALADLPGARLTMVFGTEELMAEVCARVQRSPALRDRVRLAGAVPHERLAAFYSAADLFLVGSHHEGSGYSLMEACACGALPVVTDIPTYRLLTGDGSMGALWTPGDAVGCARALAEAGRRDLDAARARLAEFFARDLSWSAIGRRAMAIYEEVSSRRASKLA
jgi:glycosyltransferase involved in cell wall biosynthesis